MTLSYSELVEERRRLKQVAKLVAENEELRRKSSEYLMNWVNAQDLAYNRMVQSFLDKKGLEA